MRVRTKLTLTFLALALGPLATIGYLTFRRTEAALRDSLGASYQRMAAEAIDKVDRGLFGVQERVRLWVSLELMQEVVTGDLDGRISSFLLAIGRDGAEFASIDVMDPEGKVVASSVPNLVGTTLIGDDGFSTAARGRHAVRDASRDERSGTWVVSFCEPIRAHFDESGVVGVLCARWNVGELRAMTEGRPDDPAIDVTTLVMRSDGLEISTPEPHPPSPFSGNLVERGMVAARLASQGNEGYAVEGQAPGEARLVGYSSSQGYRDFPGLGWSALVVQDLDRAFAPIRRLELLLGGAGAVTAALVVVLSLLVSRQLTAPLARMAEVARRIARGDFGERVSFRSSDEIGTLAEAFDRMMEELEQQRAQLVAEVERVEQAERDATAAKDAAEEFSTRLSAVLDTMGEGLLTLDSDGTITLVNQELCRRWGYAQEELIGQDVALLLREDAATERARASLVQLASAGGRGKQRLEAEGRRRDGTLFPLEIVAATTRLRSGRVVATAATLDLTERHRAEEQIRASLAEKEALLKEVHHRVKNNLQVVVSLLRLQSDNIKDRRTSDVFRDSESRIRSMALTHEMLYRSGDLARIDVAQYLGTLTRDLLATYGGERTGIALEVDVEPITLGMDDAIHCGLLVNELVSNAIKYAYPGDGAGVVRIALRQERDGGYLLVVADEGVGLPGDIDDATGTLGLQLVKTLTAQLEGSVRSRCDRGTTFEVRFRATDDEDAAGEAPTSDRAAEAGGGRDG